MDERVRNEYRKIYAELCCLLMLALAASVLTKVMFLGMAPAACITEFLLLVGAPVYCFVRQMMLGIDAEQQTGARLQFRNYVVSLVITVGVMTAGIRMRRHFETEDLATILGFVAAFTFVWFASRALASWNAKRHEKPYRDD